MLIREMIDFIEEILPSSLQDDWDNSGFQVGDKDRKLEKVLLCLDVTNEAIDMAVSQGVNLIVSHHPLIFNPIRNIDADRSLDNKLIRLIESRISLYSAHTSADVSGLNEYVFEKIGFKSQGKLEYKDETHGYGDFAVIDGYKQKDLANLIKDRLKLDHIIVYGDKDKEISSLALVTGAGGTFLEYVFERGINLLITSELKQNQMLDAVENGVTVFDIGHHGSEILFVDFMAEVLKDKVELIKYIPDSKYIRKVL